MLDGSLPLGLQSRSRLRIEVAQDSDFEQSELLFDLASFAALAAPIPLVQEL